MLGRVCARFLEPELAIWEGRNVVVRRRVVIPTSRLHFAQSHEHRWTHPFDILHTRPGAVVNRDSSTRLAPGRRTTAHDAIYPESYLAAEVFLRHGVP